MPLPVPPLLLEPLPLLLRAADADATAAAAHPSHHPLPRTRTHLGPRAHWDVQLHPDLVLPVVPHNRVGYAPSGDVELVGVGDGEVGEVPPRAAVPGLQGGRGGTGQR